MPIIKTMALRKKTLLILGLWLAPALLAERVPGRYIVELDGEPVAERVAKRGGRTRLAGPEAADARAVVRGEQDAARLLLSRNGATVLASVETVANRADRGRGRR